MPVNPFLRPVGGHEEAKLAWISCRDKKGNFSSVFYVNPYILSV